MRRLVLALALAASAAFFVSAPGASAAIANQLPATGDIAACSGRPWVDVLCYGADPSDTTDSGAAFANAWNAAVAGGFPLHIPAGTYKFGAQLVSDASGLGAQGLRIIAENATLDMTGVATGPAWLIERSGGTVAAPAVAQGIVIDGRLTVDCNLAGFCVELGKTDFSDEFRDARIDGLAAVNASSSAGAGGMLIEYADAGDFTISASALGSASGAALELDQVERSWIAGRLSAAGASAPSLLLANGKSTGNVFSGLDYGASPVCLEITSASAANNLFLSPDLSQCPVPISAALMQAGNALVAPKLGVIGSAPLSTGIAIVGRGGGISRFAAPFVSTFTASGADDGTLVSSANATGIPLGWSAASLAVTLPSAASVGPGWSIGFATDAQKAITVSGATIVSAGESLSSLTLGPGNGEIAILRSDGSNYRLISASPGTRAYNGLTGGHLTGRWIFPGGPGYQATQFDNGETISSGGTAGSLALTLPPINTIEPGWALGFAADKAMTITTASASGGHIQQPDGSLVSTMILPGYALGLLEFDGAVFRVRSSGLAAQAPTSGIAAGCTVLGNGGPDLMSGCGQAGSIGALAVTDVNPSTSSLTGALTVAGGLGVGGALNLGQGAAIGGAASIGSTLSVGGNSTFDGRIDQEISDGNDDLVIGGGALPNPTPNSNDQNVAIGRNAYAACTICNGGLAVGWNAGAAMQAGRTMTALGFVAGEWPTGGSSNTFVGAFAGRGGPSSGPNQPQLTGGDNTGLGEAALINIYGGATANTGLGFNALFSLGLGNDNTGIGTGAGSTLVNSSGNTAIGVAAYQYGMGGDNVAVGLGAASGSVTVTTTTADFPSGNGPIPLASVTGFVVNGYVFCATCGLANYVTGINTVVNTITLAHPVTGDLGNGALMASIPNPNVGSLNTAVGENSLTNLSGQASSNVGIGPDAGPTLETGSSNILIGNATADVPSASTSNFMNIGNTLFGTNVNKVGNGQIGIGTASPDFNLDVTGTFGFSGTQNPPSASSSPCTAREWTWTETYIYVCVSANTWRRVAFSAF